MIGTIHCGSDQVLFVNCDRDFALPLQMQVQEALSNTDIKIAQSSLYLFIVLFFQIAVASQTTI